MLLGLIAIALGIYIALLVYRLRAQTRRLQRRIDFEATMSRVKERLDGDFEDFDEAMTASVALLAEFFEAGRHRFAIIDVETGGIEQQFGSPENKPFERMTRNFSTYLMAEARRPEGSGERFHYQNLQRQGELAFTGNATSAGAAIASQISDRDFGNRDFSSRNWALLIFEHREAQIKPRSDEIQLLRGAIEALTHCVEIHRGRREKQRLEARLEHSQRLEAAGTLAGGIAHEFNNVLGAMLGYGEMALQVLAGPSQPRHYVEQIVASGERAKHIIDQILTFSRRRERVSRPFDITEAVADVMPLLRLSLPHGFELVASLSDKILPVVGNPIEVQQIVMNLCKNAVQASTTTQRVEVVLRRFETTTKVALSHGQLVPDGYALLRVSDSGDGIAASVLPHIFEPFFTTKSRSGGTGLGLAAVHDNVAGMGGQLHVESRLNVGTQFDVYFPLCRQQPVPLKQFFDERSVQLGHGETVLILEREQALRQMYEEKIAALGYEPIGFPRLEALLAWLRVETNTPDLIIADVASAAVSDLMKTDALFGPTPVLLITDPADDTAVDRRVLRTMGALRKPVNSISLASAVFNKLNQREPQPSSRKQAMLSSAVEQPGSAP
jgi:signal transduction histidine kinase